MNVTWVGWFAAAALLLVLAIPAIVVGLAVLIVASMPWVLLGGLVLLLAAAVIGRTGSRGFSRWEARRREPHRRNQYFVSYRTAEHAHEAQRVAEILERDGAKVFLARPGQVDVDDRPTTAFRRLGMFFSGDLDADLRTALENSDALVYIVPKSKDDPTRSPSKPRIRDFLDSLLAMLLFERGRSQTFWQTGLSRLLYGRSLSPAVGPVGLGGASWQDWELATAVELGLEVIRISFLGEPAAGSASDTVTSSAETLDRDIAERVLPRLRKAMAAKPKLSGFLPSMGAGAVLGISLSVAAGLSVIGLVVLFVVRALI